MTLPGHAHQILSLEPLTVTTGLYAHPGPPVKRHQQCRWPFCGARYLTPGELKRHKREARHYGELPEGQAMGQGISHAGARAKPPSKLSLARAKAGLPPRKVREGKRGKPFPWTLELVKRAQVMHRKNKLMWSIVALQIDPTGALSHVAVKTMVHRLEKGRLKL